VISKGRALATGTLAELRGQRASVRLRVTSLADGWWHDFAGFGRWKAEGEWLLAEDVAAGQVPDLVAAIVARGGRVEAVVPEQQSLEARFLELLGEA
jgi:hypothetical protein